MTIQYDALSRARVHLRTAGSCRTVLVDEIELGSVLDQQRHHLLVARFAGHEDGRSLVGLAANVGVGAGLQ